MFKYFIGIDVSKSSFNFCVVDEKLKTVEKGVSKMNEEGFNSFLNIINRFPDSVIALESTGSYHLNILSFIICHKKEVCLVNPVLVKKFIQTISLRKTKTDEIDANIIAKFIFHHHRQVSFFIPDNMDEITSLARVREDISREVAKMKTKLKQDVNIVFPELAEHFNIFTKTILDLLESFPTAQSIKDAKIKEIENALNSNKKGKKSTCTAKVLKKLASESISIKSSIFNKIIEHDVKTLKFFINQLDDITKNLINEIKKSKSEEIKIVTSINGVSDITAAHFIAEIKDIKRFDNRNKLIAYAGTDPAVKESGTSLHSKGRITKKGSKSLRRTIYLMASGVMKYAPHFRQYYDKKRNQGMQHRKAMIALGNKLLRVIFGLLKKGEMYVAK